MELTHHTEDCWNHKGSVSNADRMGVVTSLFPERFPPNKRAICGNQHKAKKAVMSKKDKKEFSPEDDVQAAIAMVPKLQRLLDNYKEVTKEYQKYRKMVGMRFLVSRNIWVALKLPVAVMIIKRKEQK